MFNNNNSNSNSNSNNNNSSVDDDGDGCDGLNEFGEDEFDVVENDDDDAESKNDDERRQARALTRALTRAGLGLYGPSNTTCKTKKRIRIRLLPMRVKEKEQEKDQDQDQEEDETKDNDNDEGDDGGWGSSKKCWKYVSAFVGLAMIVLLISARVITTAIYKNTNSNKSTNNAVAGDGGDGDGDENKNNTAATAATDIPVTSWKQPRPRPQPQQQPLQQQQKDQQATFLQDCPGTVMDHPEYVTSSSYFEHLAAFSATTNTTGGGNGGGTGSGSGSGGVVHLSYSLSSSFGEKSSSTTNSNSSNNNSWIDVDNCRLDCHGVELRPPRRARRTQQRRTRRKRMQQRRRNLSPSVDWETEYPEEEEEETQQSDYYYRSLFRVTNGGYLQNCIIKFILVDEFDEDEDNENANNGEKVPTDGPDDDDTTTDDAATTNTNTNTSTMLLLFAAGVTCDRNDCTIRNVQCYSNTDDEVRINTNTTTTTSSSTTGTSTSSGSTLTTMASTGTGTSTCILIDTAQQHQAETSLRNPNSSWVSGFETNVPPSKKTTDVKIIGGRSTTPLLDHGIIARLPAPPPSSTRPPSIVSQDILVSVEDFVIDRVSNSGIKVSTTSAMSSSSSSLSSSSSSSSSVVNDGATTTTTTSSNHINLRFVNVTSSNNGGDGLELDLSFGFNNNSAEEEDVNNVMVAGGLYRNNVGNGVHVIHGSSSLGGERIASSSSSSSSSPSSKTSRIVVTGSTSISHNGRNGIRIKNDVPAKSSSSQTTNDQHEQSPSSGFYYYYYVLDSASVHDNAWFGIVMLDDVDDDGSDDQDEVVDSSSTGLDNNNREGREIIDLLVRNTYVARNGHDGMLVVRHNTSVTIEQSSFNQNGYFDNNRTDDDKRKTANDTPPSSTAASSSSFSRSSPYGSGAAIYEPYAVAVSRSEFMDNLQNGLSIMDLQLQHMIVESVDPSGGSDGSASAAATRLAAAVQLSYLKLFHNDRDGLVIIDSDNDDDSDLDQSGVSGITSLPHVEIDNLTMCSNTRNGMTLFHLKSLEINSGVVSCRNLDGNGGWDYQLGGINVEDIFSTTDSFATPTIVGDTCTNGGVGVGGGSSSIGGTSTNFCSNDEYLTPCQDDSCDPSSTTTNSDDAYPTIGASSSSSSSSSQPSLDYDESSINV
eukprot:CAMPEP_0113492362 /NCGR_PEP_ID=MMETSP0014_2-20120614/28035_1 /TAXON_ID=2857 /ORGANISM="Nitzschia sp." /LENGTH=1152 /DNA_ID=CAMNT_0000386187 /DNA_START=261 /DNA_END=3719 /DNA_ORIENTATION=- /assembly_acc=CAM_ASM_000159